MFKSVLGVTAYLNAGKGETTRQLRDDYGYQPLEMSDRAREALRVMQELAERDRIDANRNNPPEAGQAINRDSLTDLTKKWRQQEGFGAVGLKMLEYIEENKEKLSEKIVIAGIRSPEEVELFRSAFPGFKLIVVHASMETRLERYIKRALSGDRKEDVADPEKFFRQERIERFSPGYEEFGQNLPACYELADYIVVNEENSLEPLRRELAAVMSHLEGNRPDLEGRTAGGLELPFNPKGPEQA